MVGLVRSLVVVALLFVAVPMVLSAAERQGVPAEELDMTNVEAFYVIDGSYIDGTLDHAVEQYGSMEAYVRDGLGLTDEEIERLRDQLLEPARQ